MTNNLSMILRRIAIPVVTANRSFSSVSSCSSVFKNVSRFSALSPSAVVYGPAKACNQDVKHNAGENYRFSANQSTTVPVGSPKTWISNKGWIETPSKLRISQITPPIRRRVDIMEPVVPRVKIDLPLTFKIVEKQAARLVVIRRIKMNKHKLRKLRKKMKFVWAKVRLRRKIRQEKAYLDGKMELIRAAQRFDAEEYVRNIIQRAKQKPIPFKWTDPLMPEWFKNQELEKEERRSRHQKIVNIYLNKPIKVKY